MSWVVVMLKNVSVVICSILVVLFWLSAGPENEQELGPNEVTIKYECDDLDSYKNVPHEVIQECKSRGFSVKETI